MPPPAYAIGMLRVEIGRRADADLEHIYGAARFGTAVADATATDIIATLSRLAEFPLSGSKVANRGDGMRRVVCGPHVIYYVSDAIRIYVARVLHGRMDRAVTYRGQPVLLLTVWRRRWRRRRNRPTGRVAFMSRFAWRRRTWRALFSHRIIPSVKILQ